MRRDRVPSGVSVGILGSIDELLKTVAGYLAEGYQRIKLKIKPGWEVEPIRAGQRVLKAKRIHDLCLAGASACGAEGCWRPGSAGPRTLHWRRCRVHSARRHLRVGAVLRAGHHAADRAGR